MPISADVVGATSGPVQHRVDRRWVLAYAAGLGDVAPAVFAHDADAHPLFVVGPEWPAILSVRGTGVTRNEASRAVHAGHDAQIHRRIRPGDDLATTATVVAAESGRQGAVVWTRLTTIDADGSPVATTFQRGVYLGVAFEGEPRSIDAVPPWPVAAVGADSRAATIAIGPQDAHIYTECARIWNPIHTEMAAALAAGLPALLLHGTATLAKAVSAVDELVGAGNRDIARIAGRFASPVPMPCSLTIEAWPDGRFEVRLPDGSAAIRDGRLQWASAPASVS